MQRYFKLIRLTVPSAMALIVLFYSCPAVPVGAADVAGNNANNKDVASPELRVRALEQHGSVTGAQLVFMTPDAVRIDCPKKGTIILCRAPGWKVCSYSLKTKKYFEVPLAQYVTLFKKIIVDEGIDLSTSQLEKVGDEKFFSRRCSVYKPILSARAHNVVTKKFNGIWLGDDFKIPSQIGDLLDRELGLPPMHKVLMKVDYQRDDFNTHALTTTYCHERSVPADWFELPGGLTKARSGGEVYPSNNPEYLP